MVNPTYFGDINTRVEAVIDLAETKIAALDAVVNILKAKGVATQNLESGCNKIHTQIETLQAVMEIDNP